MNLSIKKIFTSVTTLMALFILILAFASLVMLGEHNSQKQILLLQKHRAEINQIRAIDVKDETLAMIELQNTAAKLTFNLEDYAKTFDAFEPLKFISSSDSNRENFETFKELTHKFITDAKTYIKKSDSKKIKREFDKSYYRLTDTVVDMLSRRISAEHKQFVIREIIIFSAVVIGLLFLLIMHKQLNTALRDIQSLYGVTSKDDPYEIKTMEVQAIAKKFKKDSHNISDNPLLIDQVTKIKNYKGMLHAYNTTKGLKEHSAPAVCLFEIDHYKIIKSRYSAEFIALMRKKIAFMITLYEQPIDIVATVDESKFVFILARNSKKEAFVECEKIRESIADTFFKIPNGEKITITVSGGFIIKPSNKSIDASIQHAQELLKNAQQKGTNTIAQISEYSKKF
jgi:diguanylate cyclase (GGDEF)-like protein